MGNLQSNNDSYSFWEWRLFISCRGGAISSSLDDLTDNGRRFVRLEANIAILLGFLTTVVIAICLPCVFDVKGLRLTPAVGIIAGLFVLPACILVFLGGNFLLLPCVGKASYELGYINEEELQVILKYRIPKSIFVNPLKAPAASSCFRRFRKKSDH